MRSSSLAARWYVLLVMCLVYAVSIADRYVVSTVLEPIRLEFGLNDAQAGFLTGVPMGFFYVFCGIPMSWLADRANRRNILAVSMAGLVELSPRSAGNRAISGNSSATRVGVGVGEAGGTPPANSIIADYFPADRRPMALGVFALGAPIGAWLGADRRRFSIAHALGWRAAFLALGIPGVLLGLIIYLTVREPERGRMDTVAAAAAPPILESLRFLWQQRAAFHVVMASGVCALWGWGLVWFTPTFLIRSYGLDVGQAGAITGNIHLVGGILATAGTAWVLFYGRRWRIRKPGGLAARGPECDARHRFPSFIAYWTTPLPVARARLFWLFIPAIYFYIGPCMGSDGRTWPSRMRAMFTAWSLLVGNVFNLIIAPQGVGLLSDWFAGKATVPDAHSLRLAPPGARTDRALGGAAFSARELHHRRGSGPRPWATWRGRAR